jgi:hypothetical protein
MSMLCNCCVRELLILARTWFAFGLPSKTGCDRCGVAVMEQVPCGSKHDKGRGDGVAGGNGGGCAAKGGGWGGGGAHGGGHACGEHG